MIDPSNPYAAPLGSSRAEDEDMEPKTQRGVPASKWLRLANLVIDTFIIFLILMPLSLMLHFYGPSQFDLTAEDDPAADAMFNLVTIAVFVIYYVLLEASFGQTFGKLITRTKVIGENGGKPGFGQVLVRTFVRFIPFEPLSVLFKQNGRGWHDWLPSTYVVKKR